MRLSNSRTSVSVYPLVGESGKKANSRPLAELIKANMDIYKLEYHNVLDNQKEFCTEGQEKIPIMAAADNVLCIDVSRPDEKVGKRPDRYFTATWTNFASSFFLILNW